MQVEVKVKPYSSEGSKKKQVTDMFNNIAPKYDFLNRFLSAGIDQKWRKRAIKELSKEKPKIILDVATGTADFAIAALDLNPEKVIGIDISEKMLAIGKKKIQQKKLQDKIELTLGDSESLPFADNSFDAVTVAFGVRNFEYLTQGLSDIYRVLKPNGTLLVLEFSNPRKFPVKQFYRFYAEHILPTIGWLFSKDRAAYTYLPQSIKVFPDGENFLDICKTIGYQQTKWIPLTMGICSIYIAKKPA
ncbi:MAG: bifunctional demethylmenaquinone methyltransferase/2-methoxy-6-polyprenyl-1,4-benzoquinol methylase UbiE [Bacteroidia bacterium]|nr:bifunctional demethylmenaquinone methyltransferase/2-methoxy-6-polyprenyl-1,4-benzoquinol methylase UbiE [Bacteroidia bacterium]MDW8301074.1 bifunctional demethylmenaquinone methyltransferase/2-methoxy-6-polyprenyl-1,4-benzoquinol methylase UbiE [Bacteroidia bacterium]